MSFWLIPLCCGIVHGRPLANVKRSWPAVKWPQRYYAWGRAAKVWPVGGARRTRGRRSPLRFFVFIRPRRVVNGGGGVRAWAADGLAKGGVAAAVVVPRETAWKSNRKSPRSLFLAAAKGTQFRRKIWGCLSSREKY